MSEIIEMARQAGFLINELHCSPPILSFSGQENSMEAFAKLVEDAAFVRWAAQTKLAVENEREVCARDAEWCIQNHLEHHIPERIRARK